MNAVTAQLSRLGCFGQRTTVTIKRARGRGAVALLGPGDDASTDVDAAELAELLALLPSDAAIDEREEGSVWGVILGLANDGAEITREWLTEYVSD